MPNREEKEKTIRAFFAIELPQELLAQIDVLVATLKKNPLFASSRFVRPEKWHITLRFLGNISEEQAAIFSEEPRLITKEFASFAVDFRQLKLFPSVTKSHALILMPEPQETLIALSLALDRLVVKNGVTPEKRAFLPHLTLARLPPDFHSREAERFLADFKMPGFNFTATQFKLLQSESGENHNLYKTLATFRLMSISFKAQSLVNF